MECIEGRSLRGPLQLDQALKYAGQICDALAAAHEKNIVHRDLKPANILVTKSGIKLLDFGLAKREPAVTTPEATLTAALTGKGQILGTLHYMSPEQLQGEEAGPASDIFSFGLVLYEMLTGKRAFDGATPASVIAAILERDAPSIGAAAPAAVEAVLARCLAKSPEDRWQSARDVKIALELAARAAPLKTTQAPSRAWTYLAAAIVATLAAVVMDFVHFRESPPDIFSGVFEVALPEVGGARWGSILSPDGTLIAIATRDGISLRRMDSTEWQSLAGTNGATQPAWSPDSRYLAFRADGKIKKIAAAGRTAADTVRSSGRAAAAVHCLEPEWNAPLHRRR